MALYVEELGVPLIDPKEQSHTPEKKKQHSHHKFPFQTLHFTQEEITAFISI